MNINSESDRQHRPVRLVVISLIFICSGIFGVWRIISHAQAGQVYIALDVIDLFVGIGLLRLRNQWRGIGSFLAFLGAVVSGIASPLSLFAGEVQAPGVSPLIARIMFCAVFAAVAFYFAWASRVLESPQIRALFNDTHSQATTRRV